MKRICVKCRPGKKLIVDGRLLDDQPSDIPLKPVIYRHLKAGRLIRAEMPAVSKSRGKVNTKGTK